MFVLIIVTALMIAMLIWILAMFHRTYSNRKTALFVLPVRGQIKILALIIAFFSIIPAMGSPYSWIFIGFAIFCAFVFFSIDLVITKEGINYGLNFMSWERIRKIEHHALYLNITMEKRSSRKDFYRIIWKITAEDVKKIQSLWEGQRTAE